MVKTLEEIVWDNIAEHIREVGGMILYREIYEEIIEEEYQEGFEYLPFITSGELHEAIEWIIKLQTNFDFESNELISDALVILGKLEIAIIEPQGSAQFEEARNMIRDSILVNLVTKTEIVHTYDPENIVIKYHTPKIEDILPSIINLFKSL